MSSKDFTKQFLQERNYHKAAAEEAVEIFASTR